MTYKEAIRILHPNTTLEALTEYEYYGGFNGKEARIKAVEEACVVACEALKRAEKKKPILKDHDHDEYFSMSVECGNCGAALGGWDYGRAFCEGSKEWFIEQNLFCRRCGQALDWSDVK